MVVGCEKDRDPEGDLSAPGEPWPQSSGAAVRGCPIQSSYSVAAQLRGTAVLRGNEVTVSLASDLLEPVALKTLVVVRRTGERCTPPTGERVSPVTVLSPGGQQRVEGVVAAFDAHTSSITVTVTGTTTAGRQIRTPDVVLPVP